MQKSVAAGKRSRRLVRAATHISGLVHLEKMNVIRPVDVFGSEAFPPKLALIPRGTTRSAVNADPDCEWHFDHKLEMGSEVSIRVDAAPQGESLTNS